MRLMAKLVFFLFISDFTSMPMATFLYSKNRLKGPRAVTVGLVYREYGDKGGYRIYCSILAFNFQ